MTDVGGIARLLPHRYPILLVDQVTEVVAGERLTARKAVTGNEPWYADVVGAADADLAYPPVLLIESWCQAAGLLAAWDRPNPDVLTGDVMLFGSIADVQLPGRVLPGDVVEHHVRLVRALSDTVICDGDSTVDGREVLSVGRVVMALRPATALRAAVATATGGDHG